MLVDRQPVRDVRSQHARIEFRRDRFVLVDQSLNGTYLHRQGMAEIVLRRDEIGLERSGQISLGKPTAVQQPEQGVRFTLRSGCYAAAFWTPAIAASRREGMDCSRNTVEHLGLNERYLILTLYL